jgi:alpha-beta hydrolase superfamily lysophospholipase
MKTNEFMYQLYKKSFKTHIHKYEDNSECTFFYKTLKKNTKSVIWVHGFNDYFFHFHISNILLDKGYNFFSISLRNYRNDENLFYTNDLSEYIIDIEQLIEYILNNYYSEKIILYGHSMGGLISAIFCKESSHKEKISGVILNSPFFSFNQSIAENFFMNYLVYYLGIMYPKFQIRYLDFQQKNSNSLEIFKRFYFESKYKLMHIPIIYAGWITTIIYYHSIVQNNFIDLTIPILVFHSDKSIEENKEGVGDSVLNVNDIKKYSKNLGNNVKLVEIKDAVHDVFCSEKEPLSMAIQELVQWLEKLS